MMNKFEMDFFEQFKDQEISFQVKATKLNPTSSMLWRISVLSIFLYHCCSSNRSSLHKLQIFYSCVGNELTFDSLLDAIKGNSDLYATDVKFDPTLLRVLNYMISYGIISKKNNSHFKLTEAGKNFAKQLVSTEVLKELKDKLFSVQKNKYSESAFNRIFKEAL